MSDDMTPAETQQDEQVSMDAAGRRYWTDAEFHSRVQIAVAAAERGQPDDGFDRFHRDSVIAGAAMALHLADAARPSADTETLRWVRAVIDGLGDEPRRMATVDGLVTRLRAALDGGR